MAWVEVEEEKEEDEAAENEGREGTKDTGWMLVAAAVVVVE